MRGKIFYHHAMTTTTLGHALKSKKPAIIKEKGAPRYVVLDWKTYRAWEETKEDLEDTTRLIEALTDPHNQKHIPLFRVKKTLKLT